MLRAGAIVRSAASPAALAVAAAAVEPAVLPSIAIDIVPVSCVNRLQELVPAMSTARTGSAMRRDKSVSCKVRTLL